MSQNLRLYGILSISTLFSKIDEDIFDAVLLLNFRLQHIFTKFDFPVPLSPIKIIFISIISVKNYGNNYTPVEKKNKKKKNSKKDKVRF